MDSSRKHESRSLIDAIDSLHEVNHLMEACHMAGQSLQSHERGAICTVLDVAHDKLDSVIQRLEAVLASNCEQETREVA